MPERPDIFNRPMQSTPLRTALTLDGPPSQATLTVPPDWAQGRTSFGGLPAAACVRAMQDLVASDPDATSPARWLRSITVHFIAPISVGPARLSARLLRTGRHMTQAAAEVWSGDRLALMANAAFGSSRFSELEIGAPEAPEMAEPEALMAMPYIPGAMPAFTQHVDYRWASSHFPFSGGDHPVIEGWCRPHDPVPLDPAVLLMLIDAWPAPVLTMATAPTRASSVTWMVNFIGDGLSEPIPTGAWVKVAQRTTVSKGGYADGIADVWSEDGRLLARSRQLVTLFG